MTLSVSRHSPHVLTSTCAGNLSGHVHGVRQSFGRYDDLGDHDLFSSSVDFLTGDEREAPAPAADVFDVAKARNENVRNPEHFQKLVLLAHCDLHTHPRADQSLATYETICTRRSPFRHKKVGARGFRIVNGSVAALLQQPFGVFHQTSDYGDRDIAARDHTALRFVAGVHGLHKYPTRKPHELVSRLDLNTLHQNGGNKFRVGKWYGVYRVGHEEPPAGIAIGQLIASRVISLAPNGFGGRA